MGTDVVLEVLLANELLVAKVALKWLLSRVLAVVAFEVEELDKGFVALLALEWALTGMDVHVPLQMVFAAERLVTLRTLEILLRGVRLAVLFEVGRVREGSAALLTLIGFFTSVDADVHSEGEGRGEDLLAVWALVLLVGSTSDGVRVHVKLEDR